jgi:hypothetical protein
MNRTPLFRGRATTWWLAGSVALLGAIGPERTARAEGAEDDTAACVDGYERGQERLLVGALMEARERFTFCSRASCPAFIQEDCTRFLEGVSVQIPSLSFGVTSGGRHLTTVRVVEGERVLHDGATEATIELDPGRHELRFETPEAEAVTLSLVIEQGQKNRTIEVDLPPLVVSPPAPQNAEPRPALANPEPPRAERKVDATPWVVLGIGATGVGAFALLGSMGLSEEKRLGRSCAPTCSARELRSVRTKYLFADVGLAVGVTGLLAGGYLLLTRDPEPVARAGQVPLLVAIDRHGGAAHLKGQF